MKTPQIAALAAGPVSRAWAPSIDQLARRVTPNILPISTALGWS
jgi:hypothetical protein